MSHIYSARETTSTPSSMAPTEPPVRVPGSEAFAANGPSFSVAVCYEVGICDPAASVKHLLTQRDLLEPIGRP
jgi:hypothetical protein